MREPAVDTQRECGGAGPWYPKIRNNNSFIHSFNKNALSVLLAKTCAYIRDNRLSLLSIPSVDDGNICK